MYKQIIFFNHKGGVSKTTSVFHIGWMLASLGKKVILVDCDPQCNLTGILLEYEQSDAYPFESNSKILNIRDGLSAAFEARPIQLTPVELQAVKQCDGELYVLPGHVGLAEYESQLAIAHELSSSVPAFQNIPGSINWLIDITAKSIKADFVLVDVGPSLSALNQNLFCTSDAFIVPMAPDFFSEMAIRSLSQILPKWKAWSSGILTDKKLSNAAYPWPNKNPKYIGSIVQNYRIRTKDGKQAAPSRAYQKWFDALTDVNRNTLLPSLNSNGLLFNQSQYKCANIDINNFLIEVPDFNSLIAISQEISKPVFALTKSDIQTSGSVAQNQIESARRFKRIYEEAAHRIIDIV